jgi:periplasmic divalent cation tolerance protein
MLFALTTVATREDAQRLAQALVERRLVACAQMSLIESVYVWKGQVQQDSEWRLLLKTLPQCRQALEHAIQELHPYELPALVMFEAQASSEFAAWVGEAVSPAPSSTPAPPAPG